MSSSFGHSFFADSSGGFGSHDYDIEEDDGGNSIGVRYEKNKDAVLFLVDCGEQMMKKGPGGQSSFEIVMKLIKNVVQNKLIGGGRDELGVCFYNTEKAKNSNGFGGIYNAVELDEPDAKVVRELESYLDAKHFEATVGSAKEEIEFHKALWTCSAVFSKSKNAKKSVQRIMLFTGNDKPNASGGPVKFTELKNKAIQKAKDLEDLDITLTVTPINVDGTLFKVQNYFADLILVDDEDGIEKFDETVASTFDDLKARLYKRIFVKRALASCPMTIGPDIKIGLKLFSVMRPATKRTPVQLDARNNQRLTCVTEWVCATSGDKLNDYQIKTHFPYGCEKVYFTKAEMNEIKDFGPPGIKLMGFKPRSSLKWIHNTKPPLFIRPDEGQVKGSTTAFWALLEEMIALNKIAIARVIYRKCSVPRFAALLPVKEVEGDPWADKTGLYMITLPYADDSRDLDIPPQPVADDSKLPGLVAATRKLVTSLKTDGVDPDSYNNPQLQKHYANLEAMALEKEEPVEVEDDLMPDEEGFQSVKKEIETVNDIVEEVEEPVPVGKKRKAGGGRGGAAKKAKVDVDEADYYTLYENDKLKKLTVPKLKDFCRAKGLPLSGKKADILERIMKYMEDNPYKPPGK